MNALPGLGGHEVGAASREIRYGFTRESATHVLSRPFTYQLLYKSITTNRSVPPLHPDAHQDASAVLAVHMARRDALTPQYSAHSVELAIVLSGCSGTPELFPVYGCSSSDIPVIRLDK